VRAFLVGGSRSAHLLTTRKLIFLSLEPEAARHAYKLTELDKESALELLALEAPLLTETFPREAEQVIDGIGRLPLGIIVLGSYLRQEGFSGHLRRLERALGILMKPDARLRPPAAQSMPATLWDAIGLSYDELPS